MQIFYEIIEILGCFLSYFYILFATNIFFKYKSKQSKFISLSLSVIYLPLTYDLFSPFPNTISSILAMLFTYLVIVFCFDGNPILKAILVLIYNIFSVCISNLYFSLVSSIFHLSISDLVDERNSIRVSIIISLYLFEFIILFIIRKFKKQKSITVYDGIELSIAFLFLLIDFIFAVFSFMVLSYQSNDISLIIIACCSMSLLCLACAFVAIYLLNKLRQQHLQILDNISFKMQLNDMDTYIKDIEKTSSEIKALRHDMKNKLLAYKSLLTDNNIKAVISDISATLSLPSLSDPLTFCSNSAINALLWKKVQVAKENQIDFHCKIMISPEYHNLQLMVALANLIDNAIEYELKEPDELRFISLSIIQNKDNINIIIENYISGSVLDNNPLLHTTKENSFEHGFGIKNIKYIINSLGGMVEFFEEGNSFFAQILL